MIKSARFPSSSALSMISRFLLAAGYFSRPEEAIIWPGTHNPGNSKTKGFEKKDSDLIKLLSIMRHSAAGAILVLAGFYLFIGGKANLMAKNAEEASELSRYLPKEVKGWREEGRDKFYNPETIFDYIDGAGEVYRAYNFQNLVARRYLKEGRPNLIADFFDMGSSADAFGVFTHDLEGEPLQIGQGAVYKGGLLSFWKDHCFVSLYAETETAETKLALLTLGEAIASAIPRQGKKPVLLSYVPENFNLKTARYFHNHLILNYHFFVSSENILLLDQKTEAVLCSSGEKAEKAFLLIVRYPDTQMAGVALQNLARVYMPDAAKSGLVQTEDKKWTAVKNKGDYLVVLFNAPLAAQAKNIIAEVASKIPD